MAKIYCIKRNVIVVANKSFYHLMLNDSSEIPLLHFIDKYPSCESITNDYLEPASKKSKTSDRNDNETEKTVDSSSPVILSSALSNNGTYFALAKSSKVCQVYKFGDWSNVYRSFKVTKAATALIFDKDENHLLVADRAGFIKRFYLNEVSSNDGKIDDLQTLLGHYSIVLDMCLTTDGRFLLSADRDEHLRLSRYPQCFVVEKFFLGHTSYIKTIETVSDLVFSAGGDGELKVWKLGSEDCLASITFMETSRIKRIQLAPNEDSKDVIRLALIFEESDRLKIVQFDKDHLLKKVDEHVLPSHIADIAFIDANSFLALTRSHIIHGNLEDSRLSKICLEMDESVKAEFFENVSFTFKEQILLDKKIGFANVEEYEKRKRNRLKQD